MRRAWCSPQAIESARARGFQWKSGVESEFFVLDPDGAGIADAHDTQAKPCYDQMALLRRYELIREICDVMYDLGWEPYQNDHEDANGQFEMNWSYSDALTTADRHAFFKFMVRHLAEKHELRATFMPKPFSQLTGSGCHVHFSLWDAAGDTNMFLDDDGELGLSETAYHFLGGVLHAAEALCAITNPTVNSYKRLNAPTDCVRIHVGAQCDQLRRQQSDAHGARPRSGTARDAPARRRRQSRSAASRSDCGGAGRDRAAARSRRTPRHQYVRGRSRHRRQASTAELARRLAQLRRQPGDARRARR